MPPWKYINTIQDKYLYRKHGILGLLAKIKASLQLTGTVEVIKTIN